MNKSLFEEKVMKLFASALVAGLLFVVVQDVQAFDPKRGNALWGKYAIQTCRSCHKVKGLTQLDPKERETEKWEALFANDYIKLRQMDHDFKAAGINDRQLENIYRYLIEESQVQMVEEPVAVATPVAPAPKTITPSSTKKTVTPGVEKKAAAPAPTQKAAPAPTKVAAVAPAKTADTKFDPTKGNAGKGRYVFRKCLSCHKKNNAASISPADRTKKAWGRYFARDYRKFKKAMPEFDSYNYTTAQMEHLHQFLLKYALDAAQPKTCE